MPEVYCHIAAGVRQRVIYQDDLDSLKRMALEEQDGRARDEDPLGPGWPQDRPLFGTVVVLRSVTEGENYQWN